MKKFKIYLFFVLYLLSSSIQAQTPVPKAAFDVFPRGYYIKMNNQTQKIGDYRVRLGVDYSWKDFTFSGDAYTYMDYANRKNSVTFSPKLAEYYVTIKYTYKKINISYQHLCIHPIKVDVAKDTNIYGGYDMLSISYNY